MNLFFIADTFSPLLSSAQCNELLTKAAQEIFPQATCSSQTYKKGEDYFLFLAQQSPRMLHYSKSHDPFGHAFRVPYLLSEAGKAYLDAGIIAGKEFLKQENFLQASSRGIGEVIRDAINRGAKEIYLSLSGLATFDGGMGLLQALGYRFLRAGKEIAGTGEDLSLLTSIDDHNKDSRLEKIKIYLLEDTKIPYQRAILSSFYGGKAGIKMKKRMQVSLYHYRKILNETKNQDVFTLASGGCGGGLSGALQVLLQAKVLSGARGFLRFNDSAEQIKKMDYVVTSAYPKSALCRAVSEICRQEKVPCAYLGGADTKLNASFSQIFPPTEAGIDERQFRQEAVSLLLQIREDYLLNRSLL